MSIPSNSQILSDSTSPVNKFDYVHNHLDRCHCGCFISPKDGICNNRRCKHFTSQVKPPKPWRPPHITFTTNKELIGKPVEQPTPLPCPTKPTSTIDWNRVQSVSLQDSISKAARQWSFKTGESFDELRAAIEFNIINKASLDPDFLGSDHNDYYIVNFGVWRTVDKLRHESRLTLDPDIADDPALISPDSDNDLALIIADLPQDQRQLASILIREDCFTGTGRFNTNKVAKVLGISWKRANRATAQLSNAIRTAYAV